MTIHEASSFLIDVISNGAGTAAALAIGTIAIIWGRKQINNMTEAEKKIAEEDDTPYDW